jgi:hypothetical protein
MGGVKTHEKVELGAEEKEDRNAFWENNAVEDKAQENMEDSKGRLPSGKQTARDLIEDHRRYFKAGDWDRLLYILQQIILGDNGGVRHLWQFLNSYEGKKRFRKGKRVFQILSALGL